jgi:hypothetical protein
MGVPGSQVVLGSDQRAMPQPAGHAEQAGRQFTRHGGSHTMGIG